MNSKHILIVEDEAIVAKNIENILKKKADYKPFIAFSKKEAMEQIKTVKPDLVLMDVKLKGKADGIETATEIRTHFDIPIVYLTAYADDEIIERAKITEPFGYILKPFEEGELYSAIEIALYKHRLDKSLKESEERYRIAIEHSNDGVAIVKGDQHIYVNQKFLEIFGYDNPEEVLGESSFVNVHPDDREMVMEKNRLRQKGELVRDKYEFRGIRKDGTLVYIEVSANQIVYKGEPATLAYLRDVTERKEAEEILRRSEEHFRSLVENVPDALVVIDKKGVAQYESPSLEHVLGYSPQDFIGKKVFNFVHPDDLPKVMDEFKVLLKNPGSTRSFNIWYKHKNGSWCFLECSAKNLLEDKAVAGVVMNVRDITERKYVEEELREAYTQLTETQQELLQSERLAILGKFSSGIAHELRNPLANMSASAQFCISKYKPDEPIKKHLEVILRNSESANRIIKELLDLAKPSQVSSQLGQIGEVIDKACDLVKTRCEKLRILLHKRWSRRLPLIYFDGERMEKAFLNIILNALDAMPRGGRLSITTYYDSLNGEVITSFSDTGDGIAQKHLDNIFTPFFTTKKEGTGLGLCLTQQVINYHKGSISLRSEIGQGTEVIVRLPISREQKIKKGLKDDKDIDR
jgi:two-component system, sporulation sensor kinase A